MNARLLSLFLILTCATTLIAGTPGLVHAASAAPQVERDAEQDSCVQRCFDRYVENLRHCKEVCRRCTFSVLGLCLARTTDPECLKSCRAKAEDIYHGCVADCVDA